MDVKKARKNSLNRMWNLELSRWWWGETIHAKQASPIKNGSYEGDTRWTGYGKVGLGKYRDTTVTMSGTIIPCYLTF